MTRHSAAESLTAALCRSLALLALSAGVTHAQQGVLRGVVNDSAGMPIRDADVVIMAQHQLTRTDDKGRFMLRWLQRGPADLSIRRLGYFPKTIPVVLNIALGDSLMVVLAAQANVLSAIEVNTQDRRQRQSIEDFYRRRARGLGTYVTREEILAQRATVVTDALRNTPGIRVVRTRGSQGIRFVSSAIVRRECMPMLWLDGQRAPGMEVDELSVGDIEGMELYQGPSTTPMQFSQGSDVSTCGTVVVWSRPPGA